MAYNKFKRLEQLYTNFGINEFMANWLPALPPYPKITTILEIALQEASQEPLTTEKAKSESIVVPILKELKRNNPSSFTYFSGFELEKA